MPYVLAAGWGGMGTVSEGEDMLLRDAPHFFLRREEPRRPSRRLDDAPRFFEEYTSLPRVETTATITPAELAVLLNSRIMPPLPTLDELRDIGADAIVAALRALSDKGEPEEALVIALLYLLAESEAGNEFERQARRSILKAYKAQPAHSSTLDVVMSALRDCSGWDSLVPNQDAIED